MKKKIHFLTHLVQMYFKATFESNIEENEHLTQLQLVQYSLIRQS